MRVQVVCRPVVIAILTEGITTAFTVIVMSVLVAGKQASLLDAPKLIAEPIVPATVRPPMKVLRAANKLLDALSKRLIKKIYIWRCDLSPTKGALKAAKIAPEFGVKRLFIRLKRFKSVKNILKAYFLN
jgi:hypothetical protein